jgi:transposase
MLIVDALGNPLRFVLTGGQNHDITQGSAIIAGYTYEHVIGDRASDADDFRQRIGDTGGISEIPSRGNRKDPVQYDEYLYRERHLVECFSNKIKHYRRVFSRFHKLSQRYIGFL